MAAARDCLGCGLWAPRITTRRRSSRLLLLPGAAAGVYLITWPGSKAAPGESGSARASDAIKGPNCPVGIVVDITTQVGCGEPVHLFGHDFGAAVALGAAVDVPSLFASVTAFHCPSMATGGAMSAASLAKVTVPTHLLWVKSDQFHPLKTGRAVFGALSGMHSGCKAITVIDAGIYKPKQSLHGFAVLGARLTAPAVEFARRFDTTAVSTASAVRVVSATASGVSTSATSGAEADASCAVDIVADSDAPGTHEAATAEPTASRLPPGAATAVAAPAVAVPQHAGAVELSSVGTRPGHPSRARMASQPRRGRITASRRKGRTGSTGRAHSASGRVPVAATGAGGSKSDHAAGELADNRGVGVPVFGSGTDGGSMAWHRSVARMRPSGDGSGAGNTRGLASTSAANRPRKQRIDNSARRAATVDDGVTGLGYPPEQGIRAPGHSRTVFVTPPEDYRDGYDNAGPSSASKVTKYVSTAGVVAGQRAFPPTRGRLVKFPMPWGRSVRGLMAGPWFKGSGDDEAAVSAPVLISCHGWGRNSQMRNQQHLFARMADAGWRVVAVDQPGFGHTPGLRHSCRSEHSFSDRGPIRVCLAVLVQLGIVSAEAGTPPSVEAAAAAARLAKRGGLVRAPDLVKALAGVASSASSGSSATAAGTAGAAATGSRRATSAPLRRPDTDGCKRTGGATKAASAAIASSAAGAGNPDGESAEEGFTYASFRSFRNQLLPVARGVPFAVMGSSWGGGIACALSEVPAIRRRLTHLMLFGASYTDHTGVLPCVRARTLIVWVKDDPIHPVGLGRYMFEQIPGAEMVEVASDASPERYGAHTFESMGPQFRAPVWEWLRRNGLPAPDDADP